MRTRPIPAFLLILSTALFLQQATAAQTAFKSAIRARVVDDLTKEGISTVRVTLNGGDIKDPVVVTSDGQGNVLFPGLNAGRYRLDVDKAGYFAQQFPDIVVAGNETGNAEVKVGDLILTAQRTISGTVKWDDGDPMANTIVHVMSFRAGSYSRAPFIQTVRTNERGEYRIEGLRARRYIVFTYQPPQIVMPGTAVRVALPVFYPGTNQPDRAQILDMRTTRDMTGLSLVTKEENGVAIEGTVTAETLPAGSPVQLGVIIPGVPTPAIVATQTKVGDPFRLYPVPPGSYLLFAQGLPLITPPPPGTLPSSATATPATPPQPPVLREPIITAIPVTVNPDTPVRGFNVNFPAITVIAGKMEVDEAQRGQPPKISPAQGVALALEWLPKMESQYGIIGGQPDPQGNLRILGGVKGQAYIPGPGSGFGGAYVASIKQGQNDLAAGGLPVIAGGDPVQVLLKRDGGRIEGRVSDGTKAPWRAFVVLAPKDRRIEFWFRTAYTMSDGSFQITNIPPGEYDLFAFDRNDEDVYYNADFLRRYAAAGKAMTVAPYSTQSADLNLTTTAK